MYVETLDYGIRHGVNFNPEVVWPYDRGMKIKCEQGYLSASLDKRGEPGRFHIEFVRVYRDHRCGIGRALLSVAKDEAIKYGARRITAEIISQECVVIMQDVFGEENVNIRKEAEYWEVPEGFYLRPPKAQANALLEYMVPTTEVTW